MKEIMQARFVPTNYLRSVFDRLTQLKQGFLTVDAYYKEMELLMQRSRVQESIQMTMQWFLHGLRLPIKNIVWHHTYNDMNQFLHHDMEAEAQLAEEAQQKSCFSPASRYTARAPSSPAPAPLEGIPTRPSLSTRPGTSGAQSRRPATTPVGSSSLSASVTRHSEKVCHTCGGKGHFKRYCPNNKVIVVTENGYETGDDADPFGSDDEGEDAYANSSPIIVVSPCTLSVQPNIDSQRCNLFQTKALVGPNKACKVIIDGGSCRNLARKELCAAGFEIFTSS
jgi:hypothetical protein